MGRQGRDVQVVHAGLLRCQRRQLMKVSCKETETANFGCDVLTDGPGQPKTIVRRRAPAQFVDDDERVLGGRAAGSWAWKMRRSLARSITCASCVLILP